MWCAQGRGVDSDAGARTHGYPRKEHSGQREGKCKDPGVEGVGESQKEPGGHYGWSKVSKIKF